MGYIFQKTESVDAKKSLIITAEPVGGVSCQSIHAYVLLSRSPFKAVSEEPAYRGSYKLNSINVELNHDDTDDAMNSSRKILWEKNASSLMRFTCRQKVFVKPLS